jgi:CBS domain-containing protein
MSFSHGKIISTTTGKDLGLFVKNPTLASLHRPIFDYLKEVRAQQIDVRFCFNFPHSQIKTPLITVFSHDKLTRAVALLSATKVHRVFVVDGEEHFNLVGVLSITDVLRFIVE